MPACLIRRSAPCQSPGFTLIEIMVVVVILGLLAGLVVPNVMASAHRARVQKAEVDCETIANAARMFVVDHGRVPALEDLTRYQRGTAYVEKLTPDPWGSDYRLLPGAERRQFEVRSAGPNLAMDDDDDVVATVGEPPQ